MRSSGHQPTDEAILEQLERILGHREFLATDRMQDFLRFVVDETLAGRKDTIKGYTIATRVFGRGDDFDSGQDPIVSIQAGRLRRALERYYLVAGTQDPVHIDIPKGHYVPRITLRAAQPELGGAGEPVVAGTEAHPAVDPSIAVLPFENLTDDPEQGFLAVGMTDELVTEMNRFRELIVIPCQCAKQSATSQNSPIDLAQHSGARFILQGTIRRDAETVKVSAHLTDAQSGRQIWAEGYSNPLEASRMIATQEEIAHQVVAAIGGEYGIIARRLSAESRKKPPAELSTYEAMLRYYSHQVAPTPESSLACFQALQQAAEREPQYGPVWSALATLHAQMYSMDVPGFDEPLETAVQYARRGVVLEPGSQLGRLILAYASYLADDSESFEQEIETALALNPNSPYTVGTAGYFHIMRGELERGLSLLDRAIAVNPCHPNWLHGGYVVHHIHQRDYDHALLEVEKYNPYLGFWPPVVLAAILGRLGRIEEAKVHLQHLEEQKPDFASRARELLRRTLKIDSIIDDLIEGLRAAGMPVDPLLEQ